MATGATKKREAEEIEACLVELARTHPRIVERILLPNKDPRRLGLREVWVAKRQGNLDQLASEFDDPPLIDVIDELLGKISDSSHNEGLRSLRRLIPPNARFSFITDPGNIKRLLEKREGEGVKRNTVVRSMKPAISKLLFHRLERRGAVMTITADVDFPRVDDARDVVLSPKEIKTILERLPDDELRDIATIALGTGIDQGIYPRLQVKHLYDIDSDEATVFVPDYKTAHRARTINLPPACAEILRVRSIGKEPEDFLFETRTPNALARRWHFAMRKSVGRPDVRFKDLRAVFATNAVNVFGIEKLMHIMGHSDIKTTNRYIKFRQADNSEGMSKTADRMGLKPRKMRAI